MTSEFMTGKWAKRGIPGANQDKEATPPSVPNNILMRPLDLPPMVPIHEDAIRIQRELSAGGPYPASDGETA